MIISLSSRCEDSNMLKGSRSERVVNKSPVYQLNIKVKDLINKPKIETLSPINSNYNISPIGGSRITGAKYEAKDAKTPNNSIAEHLKTVNLLKKAIDP